MVRYEWNKGLSSIIMCVVSTAIPCIFCNCSHTMTNVMCNDLNLIVQSLHDIILGDGLPRVHETGLNIRLSITIKFEYCMLKAILSYSYSGLM